MRIRLLSLVHGGSEMMRTETVTVLNDDGREAVHGPDQSEIVPYPMSS